MTTQFHELPEDEYPAIMCMIDHQTGETITHIDPEVLALWRAGREHVAVVMYEAVAMYEVNRPASVVVPIRG